MPLSLAELTAGQPFCAAVAILQQGRVVLTLNDDHLPSELAGRALRLAGVGGGQEPGETIWDCAAREAREETGVRVDLVPSPRTWFYDVQLDRIEPVKCVDELPPLLVERRRLDEPCEPGLPTGPYLYGATFLGRAAEPPRPGGDVTALLLLPPDRWPKRPVSLGDLLAAGGELLGPKLPRGTPLWWFPEETFARLPPLLRDPAIGAVLV